MAQIDCLDTARRCILGKKGKQEQKIQNDGTVHRTTHKPGSHRSHDQKPGQPKTNDHQTDHDNKRKLNIGTGEVEDGRGRKEKKQKPWWMP